MGLTAVANRVINLDLWWNWQVENQAIDRYGRSDAIWLTLDVIERVKRNPCLWLELLLRKQLKTEYWNCKRRKKRLQRQL